MSALSWIKLPASVKTYHGAKNSTKINSCSAILDEKSESVNSKTSLAKVEVTKAKRANIAFIFHADMCQHSSFQSWSTRVCCRALIGPHYFRFSWGKKLSCTSNYSTILLISFFTLPVYTMICGKSINH